MRFTKFATIVAALLTLGAVMASSAFASASAPATSHWFIGAGNLNAGESEELLCANDGPMALDGNLLGIPFEIDAAGVECLDAEIEQNGSSAEGSVTLRLTGAQMTEPNECSVPGTLTTGRLHFDIETDGSTLYYHLEPASGQLWMNVPVEGCALEGEMLVEGNLFAEATPGMGSVASEQSLTFSEAINTRAGGNLEAAGAPAAFHGGASAFLASGEEFGVGVKAWTAGPLEDGPSHWLTPSGNLGGSKQFSCEGQGPMEIYGNMYGIPIWIEAAGVECLNSWIQQKESSAEGTVNFRLTGVHMKEPEGCSVPSTLMTTSIHFDVEEEGSTVYEHFRPEAGNVWMGLPWEGCALEMEWPIEGNLYAKSSTAFGAFALEPTLTFSKAIDNKIGGGLEGAGCPYLLEGKILMYLTDGEEFGVRE